MNLQTKARTGCRPERQATTRRTALAIAAVGALGIATPVLVATPVLADDPAAGLAKSAICASCHGPLGLSPVPTYPNLAGQNRLYLEYALRLYRSGERRGEQAGMMYTVAQALSDADIADLAAYYADLPRPD
jgi:cytochrome c553